MKNSEKKFQEDKERYYSLHAPAWGGYLATKKYFIPDINNIPYENRDINVWESQWLDIDHHIWLENHPEFPVSDETTTPLTSEYLFERMEIILYYYHNGNEKEKKWASNRLMPEICGYIKSQLTKYHITDPLLYEDMLHDGYQYVLPKILKEYKSKGIDKGIKLTTFSKKNIYHAYSRAFGTYIYRVKEHYAYEIAQVKKALNKLENVYNIPEPTKAEIAAECGVDWTPQKVEIILEIIENVNMASLDEAMEVPDTYDNPQKVIEKKALMQDLHNAINKLDLEQKEVFQLFYGLHPDYQDEYFSVTQIGKLKDITFNKARTLLEKAKKKVARDKKLSSYFVDDRYIVRREPDKITKNKAITQFFENLNNDDEVLEGRKPVSSDEEVSIQKSSILFEEKISPNAEKK